MTDPSRIKTFPPGSARVQVILNAHGVWEVVLSGQAKRIRCENLDDASRIAYVYAARRRPCELIVHDAYHRVLRCELIDGNGGAAPDRV